MTNIFENFPNKEANIICAVCEIVLNEENSTKCVNLCDNCENDIQAECQVERF